MPRKISLTKRSALLVLLVFGVLLGAAWAQAESVLYSFSNGDEPNGGLVFDHKGNLYGTTEFGGNYNAGAVYKLTPEGKQTILYSFCPHSYSCGDGAYPLDGLVLDRKENLYGTASNGGSCDAAYYACGVVFKLTPKGKEKVLYSFCVQSNCADGNYPTAGVVLDQEGNLYGTTSYGGATEECPDSYSGCGVVFKLSPKGKETILYRFCTQPNCTDGWFPISGVILDRNGNLYGTTIEGGAYGQGTVFKVTPGGKETVLHSFCRQGGDDCADGAMPFASLVLDQRGNLYGATRYGGIYGQGVVFKLAPCGKETVLHSFCSDQNCTDGAEPNGVVPGPEGILYGTAFYGGTSSGCQGYPCGVAFKLTPKGKETVLYSFCSQQNCTDGSYPELGLIFDHAGNLYGTTEYGGAYRGGVVFKLTP